MTMVIVMMNFDFADNAYDHDDRDEDYDPEIMLTVVMMIVTKKIIWLLLYVLDFGLTMMMTQTLKS
jgi:hypothetical protein